MKSFECLTDVYSSQFSLSAATTTSIARHKQKGCNETLLTPGWTLLDPAGPPTYTFHIYIQSHNHAVTLAASLTFANLHRYK